ncbi:hypothetical protein ON010_g11697 [Phytophthora cinnamomi]|nr:hypothetical protein ON010_g11697 [Phytophthora cinnamomi]
MRSRCTSLSTGHCKLTANVVSVRIAASRRRRGLLNNHPRSESRGRVRRADGPVAPVAHDALLAASGLRERWTSCTAVRRLHLDRSRSRLHVGSGVTVAPSAPSCHATVDGAANTGLLEWRTRFASAADVSHDLSSAIAVPVGVAGSVLRPPAHLAVSWWARIRLCERGTRFALAFRLHEDRPSLGALPDRLIANSVVAPARDLTVHVGGARLRLREARTLLAAVGILQNSSGPCLEAGDRVAGAPVSPVAHGAVHRDAALRVLQCWTLGPLARSRDGDLTCSSAHQFALGAASPIAPVSDLAVHARSTAASLLEIGTSSTTRTSGLSHIASACLSVGSWVTSRVVRPGPNLAVYALGTAGLRSLQRWAAPAAVLRFGDHRSVVHADEQDGVAHSPVTPVTHNTVHLGRWPLLHQWRARSSTVGLLQHRSESTLFAAAVVTVVTGREGRPGAHDAVRRHANLSLQKVWTRRSAVAGWGDQRANARAGPGERVASAPQRPVADLAVHRLALVLVDKRRAVGASVGTGRRHSAATRAFAGDRRAVAPSAPATDLAIDRSAGYRLDQSWTCCTPVLRGSDDHTGARALLGDGVASRNRSSAAFCRAKELVGTPRTHLAVNWVAILLVHERRTVGAAVLGRGDDSSGALANTGGCAGAPDSPIARLAGNRLARSDILKYWAGSSVANRLQRDSSSSSSGHVHWLVLHLFLQRWTRCTAVASLDHRPRAPLVAQPVRILDVVFVRAPVADSAVLRHTSLSVNERGAGCSSVARRRHHNASALALQRLRVAGTPRRPVANHTGHWITRRRIHERWAVCSTVDRCRDHRPRPRLGARERIAHGEVAPGAHHTVDTRHRLLQSRAVFASVLWLRRDSSRVSSELRRGVTHPTPGPRAHDAVHRVARHLLDERGTGQPAVRLARHHARASLDRPRDLERAPGPHRAVHGHTSLSIHERWTHRASVERERLHGSRAGLGLEQAGAPRRPVGDGAVDGVARHAVGERGAGAAAVLRLHRDGPRARLPARERVARIVAPGPDLAVHAHAGLRVLQRRARRPAEQRPHEDVAAPGLDRGSTGDNGHDSGSANAPGNVVAAASANQASRKELGGMETEASGAGGGWDRYAGLDGSPIGRLGSQVAGRVFTNAGRQERGILAPGCVSAVRRGL